MSYSLIPSISEFYFTRLEAPSRGPLPSFQLTYKSFFYVIWKIWIIWRTERDPSILVSTRKSQINQFKILPSTFNSFHLCIDGAVLREAFKKNQKSLTNVKLLTLGGGVWCGSMSKKKTMVSKSFSSNYSGGDKTSVESLGGEFSINNAFNPRNLGAKWKLLISRFQNSSWMLDLE